MPITQEDRDFAESWYLAALDKGRAGLKAELVRVTPAMAEVMLENNPDNRTIRRAVVERIASDIQANLWKVNGEPIILSTTGLLNDGQHRLHAIIKADKAVHMLMVLGVERETRDTLDIGVARTPGDMISFHGYSHSTVLGAAARQIIGFQEHGRMSNLSWISTTRVIERAVSDELLQEVVDWAVTSPRAFKRLITPTVAASTFYLLAKKAPRQAKVFMGMFRDGTQLEADSPIYLLRSRLMARHKMTADQKAEAVIRAWNAWVRDKPLAKIQLMGDFPPILGPKKCSSLAS